MKTDNIGKLVRTNYVTNAYKNRGCQGSVMDEFFFSSCAKKKKKKKKITVGAFFDSHFLTVGREIRNITFFLGLKYLTIFLC